MLIECSFCECVTSIENVDPNAEYECGSCGKPLDPDNMAVEPEDSEGVTEELQPGFITKEITTI